VLSVEVVGAGHEQVTVAPLMEAVVELSVTVPTIPPPATRVKFCIVVAPAERMMLEALWDT
jgi:hypothetical protein